MLQGVPEEPYGSVIQTGLTCGLVLQEVPRELYGPVMVVLTMIALLLYQMKTADHKVVRPCTRE